MHTDMVTFWVHPWVGLGWVGLGHTVILHTVAYTVNDFFFAHAHYRHTTYKWLHQCTLLTYDIEIYVPCVYSCVM